MQVVGCRGLIGDVTPWTHNIESTNSDSPCVALIGVPDLPNQDPPEHGLRPVQAVVGFCATLVLTTGLWIVAQSLAATPSHPYNQLSH